MVIGRKAKTIAGPPKLSIDAPALLADRHRGYGSARPFGRQEPRRPIRSPEADDPPDRFFGCYP